MTPRKILAITLVLGSAAFGSYLVFKSQFTTPETQKNSISAIGQAANNSLLQQLANNLGSASTGNDNVTTSGAGQPALSNSDSPTNLTQFVAQSIFGRMKNLDQSNQSPFQNFDPQNPEDLAMIEQAVANLQNPTALFNPTVDDKELKISSDNSKEAKLSYLEAIKKNTEKHFTNPAYRRSFDQLTSDIETDCSGGPSINKELSGVYQDLASDYLNLAVPSDWLNLHKQIILYFQKSNLIYVALSQCTADPIRAYLAAQILPELFENAQIIQSSLNVKISEIQT